MPMPPTIEILLYLASLDQVNKGGKGGIATLQFPPWETVLFEILFITSKNGLFIY